MTSKDKNQTAEKAFWDWIDQCPKGINVSHEFVMVSDLTPHQKIEGFTFTVPKEAEDESKTV